jgi:c-di-AMP phosphodiesterase-like protein
LSWGLIHINDFNALVERSHSEHEVQKLKLEIHRTFLDYVKSLDGHLTNLGANEYLFVTTRGIFERETRGYKFIPLLQESKSSLGISLSLGVGFGKSANEAGTHARLALRQSREYGGDVCFIVREDKSVIGPVEMANPMIR